MSRVWFITGASRGFGLEITGEALRRGDSVVATARDPEPLRGQLAAAGGAALVLPLDVTDPAQIAGSVVRATEVFGRIDVLVNNAGRGLLGAVEEASDAETRQVFEVDVFGLMNVTRAVLPVMRAQRSGAIINISSSAGIIGRAGWGVYCAAKFAVEGFSESLRIEAAPLGIHVTAVEPGGFRTDFLDPSSLLEAAKTVPDYHETAGQVRGWARESNHAQPGDPQKAAKVIADLAEADSLPERLQLGQDCFDRYGEKLRITLSDREAWKAMSVSTGFGTPAPAA
jgi:NAD(P)-dependent dehydrogenase (short-subunit alcohol dehydrogenase family)